MDTWLVILILTGAGFVVLVAILAMTIRDTRRRRDSIRAAEDRARQAELDASAVDVRFVPSTPPPLPQRKPRHRLRDNATPAADAAPTEPVASLAGWSSIPPIYYTPNVPDTPADVVDTPRTPTHDATPDTGNTPGSHTWGGYSGGGYSHGSGHDSGSHGGYSGGHDSGGSFSGGDSGGGSF